MQSSGRCRRCRRRCVHAASGGRRHCPRSPRAGCRALRARRPSESRPGYGDGSRPRTRAPECRPRGRHKRAQGPCPNRHRRASPRCSVSARSPACARPLRSVARRSSHRACQSPHRLRHLLPQCGRPLRRRAPRDSMAPRCAAHRPFGRVPSAGSPPSVACGRAGRPPARARRRSRPHACRVPRHRRP